MKQWLMTLYCIATGKHDMTAWAYDGPFLAVTCIECGKVSPGITSVQPNPKEPVKCE